MSYNPHDIESKWQRTWSLEGVFEAEVDHSKPKFYCLEMFPTHLEICTWGMLGITRLRCNGSISKNEGKERIVSNGIRLFGMPAENVTKKNLGNSTR